ncbi:MAG: FAD:protein FMN transferase [Chloroflexota bacterium]
MNIMEPTGKSLTRRQFIRVLAVGTGASVATGLGLGLQTQSQLQTINETRLLMGTLVSLTLVSQDHDIAQTAVTAAFDRMAELEAIMSCFNPHSQLSRLNRDGYLVAPPPALYEVVQEAMRISVLSDGAYDPTMKPLGDLYAECWNNQQSLPSAEQIDQTRKLVDRRNMVVAENEIHFTQPGMGLTLNSIAKGYIVDAGVAMLKAHGFTNVLVDAGGDLMAIGERASEQTWEVGIASPRKERGKGLLTHLNIANGAVATSGDYQQVYSHDRMQHHILDPRTGYSPSELASATVTAPNTMLADVLATTLMVLGVSDGLALMTHFDDCEAYLVTKVLDVVQTLGLAD